MVALLTILGACAPAEDRIEPRLLEYLTEQEVHYVSVSAHALQAQTDSWWASQCEQRLQPSRITVTTEPSQIRYDFSLPVTALTVKGPHRAPNLKTIGLTVAEMRTSLKWSGNYLVDGKSGRACMRPQLTIHLSVNPQTVYVAREFPQGSCAFNHIAEHELRHVRANQAQLEQVAGQLKKELESVMGTQVFYGNHVQMRQQLEQAVTQDWLPWAKAQLHAVDEQHAVIDAPAEYARNLTVCNGDIARVVRPSSVGGTPSAISRPTPGAPSSSR